MEPKARGVAELQLCSGTGVQSFGMTADTISINGIVEDRERSETLSKAHECRLHELKSYPCESCSVEEIRKSKRCRWRACE